MNGTSSRWYYLHASVRPSKNMGFAAIEEPYETERAARLACAGYVEQAISNGGHVIWAYMKPPNNEPVIWIIQPGHHLRSGGKQ